MQQVSPTDPIVHAHVPLSPATTPKFAITALCRRWGKASDYPGRLVTPVRPLWTQFPMLIWNAGKTRWQVLGLWWATPSMGRLKILWFGKGWHPRFRAHD